MSKEYRMIVIGAGGVGSWLLPGLARMLEWSAPGSGLIIVDGDNYEPKNKERQNFSGSGNKAEVLATNLAEEFMETFIIPLPQWVVESVNENEKGDEEVDENGQPVAGKIAVNELLA